jgi:hypothetical protein
MLLPSIRNFAISLTRMQRIASVKNLAATLFSINYSLGNFMRTLAMPKTAEPWALISLTEKLIKVVAYCSDAFR